MASPERQTGKSDNNVVEIIALFLLGEIKKKDMGDNTFVLEFYLGLMNDDPVFRRKVNSRKNAMVLSRKNGKRIPLYKNGELRNAKKHRKRKRYTRNPYFQLELFSKELSTVGSVKKNDYIDPEKKLAELHKEFNFPYRRSNNSLVDEEIRHYRSELRKVIGLPIARGKDPHRGDVYYKFLVRRIVKLDVFKIFREYNGIKFGDEPTDLDIRISQVKSFVGGILVKNIGIREKYDRYHGFANKYGEEWNIII